MIERARLQAQDDEPIILPKEHLLIIDDFVGMEKAKTLLDETTRTVMPHPYFFNIYTDMKQEIYAANLGKNKKAIFRLRYTQASLTFKPNTQTGELLYTDSEQVGSDTQIHTARLVWCIETLSQETKRVKVYGEGTTTGPMGDNKNYAESLKQFARMRSFVMDKLPPTSSPND